MHPVIKTNREKTGVFKGKPLTKNNEFIDNLTYDIWVVQLPNLKNINQENFENDEYRSNLYSLLQLFDQQHKSPENRHRLLLVNRLFPQFLKRVINRLKSADAENKDLEEQMHVEDEYLTELIKRDNTISFLKEKWELSEQQSVEKDRQLAEKEKQLGEKEKELGIKNEQLGEKEKELDIKNEQLGEKEKELGIKNEQLGEKEKELAASKKIIYELAKALKGAGVPIEEVMAKTNLSREEIEKL